MGSKSKARFITSAPSVAKLESLELPEFAFVGRSNVGKSSLIGKVLGQPSLVRTSRTPGRTQLLNQFVLNERFSIIDLPGYGFAKASKQTRAKLSQLVESYLLKSEALSCVFLLLDARREPVSSYDIFVWDWLRTIKRDVIPVATKMDLIPKNRQLGRLKQIEKQIGSMGIPMITSSSKLGTGHHEIYKHMQGYE